MGQGLLGSDQREFAKSLAPSGDPMAPHRIGDGPFYSGLHHLLSNRMKQPMQAPDLVKFAKNNGVSDDEIEWSGLHKLTGKVAPQQALDHIKEHAPQLGTIHRGEGAKKDLVWRDGHPGVELGDDLPWLPMHGKNTSWRTLYASGRPYISVAHDLDTIHGHVYSSDNPNQEMKRISIEKFPSRGDVESFEHRTLARAQDRDDIGGRRSVYDEYSMPGGSKYNESLLQLRGGMSYSSPHWNDPNILAHIRMKDRVDADGKRTLNLEEVQSDWHQDGAKNGYSEQAGLSDSEKERLEKVRRLNEIEPQVSELRNSAPQYGSEGYSEWINRYAPLQDEYRRLLGQVGESNRATKVPNAPLKGDHWHQLALRHALYEAAKGGHDRLSIVPSSIQNGSWDPSPSDGQQHYYDRKYPAYLDRLARKLGTRTGKVPIAGIADADENGYTDEVAPLDYDGHLHHSIDAHYIDITPEMREHILKHGVPLWGDWPSMGVRKCLVVVRLSKSRPDSVQTERTDNCESTHRLSRTAKAITTSLVKATWNPALAHHAEHGQYQGFIMPNGRFTPHLEDGHDAFAKSKGFIDKNDFMQMTGAVRIGATPSHYSHMQAYASYHGDNEPTQEQRIAVASTLGSLKKEGYSTYVERAGRRSAYWGGATQLGDLSKAKLSDIEAPSTAMRKSSAATREGRIRKEIEAIVKPHAGDVEVYYHPDSKNVHLSAGDWVEEDVLQSIIGKVKAIDGVENVEADAETAPREWRKESDHGGWVLLCKSRLVVIRKAYRIPNNPIKYRPKVDIDYSNLDPNYWEGLRGRMPDAEWAQALFQAHRAEEERVAKENPWDERVGVEVRRGAIARNAKEKRDRELAALARQRARFGTPEPVPAAQPVDSAREEAPKGAPWRLPLGEAKTLLGHAMSSPEVKGFRHGALWVLPSGRVIGHEHENDRTALGQPQVRHGGIADGLYDAAGIKNRGGAWPNGRDSQGIFGSSSVAQLMHDLGAVRVNTTKDMAGGGVAVSMHGAPTASQMRSIRGLVINSPKGLHAWEIKHPDRHADDDAIKSGAGDIQDFERSVSAAPPNLRARDLISGGEKLSKSASWVMPTGEVRPSEYTGGQISHLGKLGYEDQSALRDEMLEERQKDAPSGQLSLYHRLGIPHEVYKGNGGYDGVVTPGYQIRIPSTSSHKLASSIAALEGAGMTQDAVPYLRFDPTEQENGTVMGVIHHRHGHRFSVPQMQEFLHAANEGHSHGLGFTEMPDGGIAFSNFSEMPDEEFLDRMKKVAGRHKLTHFWSNGDYIGGDWDAVKPGAQSPSSAYRGILSESGDSRGSSRSPLLHRLVLEHLTEPAVKVHRNWAKKIGIDPDQVEEEVRRGLSSISPFSHEAIETLMRTRKSLVVIKIRKGNEGVARYWHKGKMRYDNDCVIRAIEHATGKDTAEVTQAAKKYGYVPGRGMGMSRAGAALWEATGEEPHILGPKNLGGVKVNDFKKKGGWVLIAEHPETGLHAIGYKDGVLDNHKGHEHLPVTAAFSAHPGTVDLGDMEPSVKKAASMVSARDIEDGAARHFGITKNPFHVGYILRDGRTLDFSGLHEVDDPRTQQWLKSQNMRSVDHGDISILHEQGLLTGKSGFGDNSIDDAIHEFLHKTGAVRTSLHTLPEGGGRHLVVQVMHPMSLHQTKVLSQMAGNGGRGYLSAEVSTPGDYAPLHEVSRSFGSSVELNRHFDSLNHAARQHHGDWVERQVRKANDLDLRERLRQARLSTHSSPSLAQVRAENYRMGEVRWKGLKIKIENPKGSWRKDKETHGKKWKVKMGADYGYFTRSSGSQKTPIGYDGDPVDVFIGPHPESELVFIVDQAYNDKFDEHKVVVGCRSKAEAVEVYLSCYCAGWKGLGDISSMTVEDFKHWLRSVDKSKPVSWKPGMSPITSASELVSKALRARHRVADSRSRWRKP